MSFSFFPFLSWLGGEWMGVSGSVCVTMADPQTLFGEIENSPYYDRDTAVFGFLY